MSMPTQQNPMKLLPWEQLLYDAGIHRGRSERGAQLAYGIGMQLKELLLWSEASKDMSLEEPDSTKQAIQKAVSIIKKLHETMEKESETNTQLSATADQLLIAADNERNHHELQRSRFTASAIEAIMKMTAGDRE
jgi:hypothetical protein